MVKVLNIISDTNIGGAGRAVLSYLSRRDAERFDVSGAIPRGSRLKDRVKALGAHVYEINAMRDRSLDFAAISKLKELIRTADPDIVHTHGSLSGRIAGKLCGKTVIYTKHTAFPLTARQKRFPYKTVYKLINERFSDRIIAVGPASREVLLSGGVSDARIDTMMNGVEPLRAFTPEQREKLRALYGAQERTFLVGVLARLEEYKGFRDIVRAARILVDDGDDVLFLLAGDGSFKTELGSLIYEAGLGERVKLVGFVEDTAPFLAALDLQLNASTASETSSLALLEGMSIGLPAAASNVSGNPYVIRDGENGLLFPPGNAEAMAETIKRIMNDAELRQKLSDGARRIFAADFTAERYAAEIEKVYLKALEGKKR